MKVLQSTFRNLFIFSVLLWSCQSEAQRPKLQNVSPEKIAKKQTDILTEKLNLTEDQAQKLKVVSINFAEQMQELKKSQQQKRRESFAQMKDIEEKHNKAVQSILTEEQYRTFIEIKRQNRAKRRQRIMETRSQTQKQRQNKLQALNLSTTQKTKLMAIKTKYAKEMKALRQQDNVQKKFEEFKRLSGEQDKEVKAILSEEQFEMYLRMKKEKLQKRKSKMRKMKN